MQLKSKKQIDELVQVGGGATGISMVPDPVVAGDVHANRPQDKKQGDPMKKVADGEETDPQNNVAATQDASAMNAASIAAKTTSVKEHIDAMFNGEDLSEEFIQKATTIFEAAVNVRLQEEIQEIEEKYESLLEETVQEIYEELVTKTDDYLTYVVEQWMEENKVAIESSLKVEVMEDFMKGLKNLFVEHYIDVPEEKVNVVEEMASTVEDLESRLNAQISENVELNKAIANYKAQEIFNQVSEGLALTQAEKLSTLCEGITFEDDESFKKKLEVIKESYFPSNKPSLLKEEDEAIGNNEELTENVKILDPNMKRYFSAISRTTRN